MKARARGLGMAKVMVKGNPEQLGRPENGLRVRGKPRVSWFLREDKQAGTLAPLARFAKKKLFLFPGCWPKNWFPPDERKI